MERTIVTVLGKDKVGIIAAICNYLAENNINVLDISQTIVSDDIFNMMMIVDIAGSDKKISILTEELAALGNTLGMQIKMQSEEIFNAMHRI